jgi:hypothetical protein
MEKNVASLAGWRDALRMNLTGNYHNRACGEPVAQKP